MKKCLAAAVLLAVCMLCGCAQVKEMLSSPDAQAQETVQNVEIQETAAETVKETEAAAAEDKKPASADKTPAAADKTDEPELIDDSADFTEAATDDSADFTEAATVDDDGPGEGEDFGDEDFVDDAWTEGTVITEEGDPEE